MRTILNNANRGVDGHLRSALIGQGAEALPLTNQKDSSLDSLCPPHRIYVHDSRRFFLTLTTYAYYIQPTSNYFLPCRTATTRAHFRIFRSCVCKTRRPQDTAALSSTLIPLTGVGLRPLASTIARCRHRACSLDRAKTRLLPLRRSNRENPAVQDCRRSVLFTTRWDFLADFW